MTRHTEAARAYTALPVYHQPIHDGAELAYRVVGEGPPVLLIHGWPLHGATWRGMLPTLAAHHRCYVVDLLGAGETRWNDRCDFSFGGQARALRAFAEALGLRSYSVIAHDSGATVARQLALIHADAVRGLVLTNTEIPGYHPPMIIALQRAAMLPGAGSLFRLALRSDRFLRSHFGFATCFTDPGWVDGEFKDLFIRPLIDDPRRLEGQLRYATGIDWAELDALAEGHGRIRQPVLLIWGEQDPWFPLAHAREMVDQLACCVGLETLPGKLFVHEEEAEVIARRALEMLESFDRPDGHVSRASA